MNEKIILLFCFSFCLFSCVSTRVVPDIGTGTEEYRNLQGEIRTGETELAVTGSELESTSKEIEGTVNELESTGSGLEQSITESKTDEQLIGEVIQRVRKRKIPANIVSAIGIAIDEGQTE